jgi:hypothetical protein
MNYYQRQRSIRNRANELLRACLRGILVAANAFFLPSLTNLAGHVSKQMLKHCSHTRMEAKRRATNSLVVTQKTKAVVQIPVEPAKESTKVEVLQ